MVREEPPSDAERGPEQLVHGVMEVDGGAGEHPHPENHYNVEGHVQQVEERPLPRPPPRSHGRDLLGDDERRVSQDEGVSRDVMAVPAEAGPPAAALGGEVGLEGAVAVGALAGPLLDAVEGLGAEVPDGRRRRQAHQRRPPGGVGHEEEGGQQQQHPTPGDFHENHVQDIFAVVEDRLRYELDVFEDRTRDRDDDKQRGE